jgi:hypothetical protein
LVKLIIWEGRVKFGGGVTCGVGVNVGVMVTVIAKAVGIGDGVFKITGVGVVNKLEDIVRNRDGVGIFMDASL